MGISHEKSLKKPSGGRKKKFRKKKKYDAGSLSTSTSIGKQKRKVVKRAGGIRKIRLRKAEFVNVYNPGTKKTQKINVKTVKESPANREYTRRNIITKGTIVETELGDVRITSRPGQHGVLNGVLLEKK